MARLTHDLDLTEANVFLVFRDFDSPSRHHALVTCDDVSASFAEVISQSPADIIVHPNLKIVVSFV